MAFTQLEFSAKDVDEAGHLLLYQNLTGEEIGFDAWERAFKVINNWRSSHLFPLRTIRYGVNNKALKIDPQSVTVQRLKRLYSITQKLERFPSLKLSQIQDIGGCRAVVNGISEVRHLIEAYKNSEIRHKLDTENDYISRPKRSGYRSHHLIYKYQSDRNTIYNGLKIEIQIRTKMQHSWATAVETVGRFIGQDLKSSIIADPIGENWERFFILMGTAIAMLEGCPPCPKTPKNQPELKSELQEYVKMLNVEDRLNAFTATIHTTKAARSKNARYFILFLNTQTKEIDITGFSQNELKTAQEKYAELESRNPQKMGKDLVFVSGDSLKEIEQAYPNYYLDTRLFLDVLKEVLK